MAPSKSPSDSSYSSDSSSSGPKTGRRGHKKTLAPIGFRRSQCAVGHACTNPRCYQNIANPNILWDRSRYDKPFYPKPPANAPNKKSISKKIPKPMKSTRDLSPERNSIPKPPGHRHRSPPPVPALSDLDAKKRTEDIVKRLVLSTPSAVESLSSLEMMDALNEMEAKSRKHD